MKTTSFRFILAALAATAALVGCTKEITPSFENDKVNPEGTRVIAVSFAPQTKTELDGFQPKFVDNDSILISNGVAIDTCEVKVESEVATISTNLTGPLTAVYPYKAAKMSEGNENEIDTVLVSTVQSGKFADANICMAKMTSENDESLSFDNKTALFKIIPGAGESTQYVEVSADGFEIANDVPTGSTHTSLETIHVNTTTADSVYVSILVPENLTVGKLTFSDGTNVKTIKDERASTAIAAGTLYTVTATDWASPEADIPEPLSGKFSVSADKQVQFSQGNLVATINESGTPTAWKFATNQYDYLGEGGANKTIGSAKGDVDLFGWSTSTNEGTSTTDNYGIKTSPSFSDYSGEFYDWGKAYCEENSITPDNTWRTLSTEEWQYLFNYESYTSDVRNGKYKTGVTVCSKANCVVLLPDNWDGTVISLTNFAAQNTYDENSTPKWSEMEAAGAVCLPAAGRRDGSDVDFVGNKGYYCSSTAYSSYGASYVNFDSSDVYPDNGDNRDYGYSVRLVTDVSAAPAPTAPAYVEITAKYDGEDKPERTLKWYRQNLAITDSGNKPWKGDNTSGAVKVPGTDEDVIVGDYFQWAASYGGYNITSNPQEKDLLLYTSFENKKCGDANDKFYTDGGNFSKSFNMSNAPYGGTSYSKYNSSSPAILERTPTANDDVANIILGDNWRMHTTVEFQEMRKVTYWAWDATDCGYYVFKPGEGTSGAANGRGDFNTSTDDKSKALLFFPAAGSGNGNSLYNAGSYGDYWSSSLDTGDPYDAYRLYFYSSGVNPQDNCSRYNGFPVRPVSDK